MEIKFTLEPIDRDDPLAIDPVGTITLESAGLTLSEPYVYLDSWFIALKTGAEQIKKQPAVEVDLVEEPEPLIFRRSNNGVMISFKNKDIFVNDAEDIILAVEGADEKLRKTQVFPKGYTKTREST
jgi:hypothetical protein